MRNLEERISRIFSESRFGTYEYVPSADKEELLYDFYVIAMLPDPKDSDLAYVLNDTKKVMFSYMKKHMLEAVFFAICCEFWHIRDMMDREDLAKLLTKNFGEKGAEFANVYLSTKSKIHKGLKGSRKWLLHNTGRGDYYRAYKAALAAMNKTGVTKSDVVRYAKAAFSKKGGWEVGYGGKPWAQICNGWLRLNYATSYPEIMIAVDHVYDLQHNNDTVFDKIRAYYKRGIGVEWLNKALTHKRYAKSLHSILPLASADLQEFAHAVIKDATGETQQSYQEKSQESKKFKIGDSVEFYDDYSGDWNDGKISGYTDLKKGVGYYVTSNELTKHIQLNNLMSEPEPQLISGGVIDDSKVYNQRSY